MKNKYKDLRKKIKQRGKVVLFADAETEPMTVRCWPRHDGYISHESIIAEGKIISIAWKAEGDKKCQALHWETVEHPLFAKLPKLIKAVVKKCFGTKNMLKFGLYVHDDTKMLTAFVEIANKADAVIMQNGNKFDIPTLQWRLNILKLPSLQVLTPIDTLALSKSAFRAPSNKLDYRSDQYGLGGKVKMTWQDWINTIYDLPGALKKMVTYNIKDVEDLQKIFWRELPYYKKLPFSLGMLVGEDRLACPKCASSSTKKDGLYATGSATKQKYQCVTCGNRWKETRVLATLQ